MVVAGLALRTDYSKCVSEGYYDDHQVECDKHAAEVCGDPAPPYQDGYLACLDEVIPLIPLPSG